MSEPHKGRTEQAKADQAAPDLSNQSTVPPSPIQMKGKILSKAVLPLYGALGKGRVEEEDYLCLFSNTGGQH